MELCGVTVPRFAGALALDPDGAALGSVADVLFGLHTQLPGWVAVRRADRTVLVPARGLRHRARGVGLAFPAALVASAPDAGSPPGELGLAAAAPLLAHFGCRCGGGPWRSAHAPTAERTVSPPTGPREQGVQDVLSRNG